MRDLTVLFYSACLKPEPFASNVRRELLKAIGNTHLISITHKPLNFGQNIVADLPVSTWSLYKQILIGAKAAKTRYIACAEDDALYCPRHFQFRPPERDTFYYSRSRWWVERSGVYRWRKRTVMSTCICDRELFIKWAERFFEKFPACPEKREDMMGWGEPGRYEGYLHLPQVKIDFFQTEYAVLTFNERPSLGGVRKTNNTDLFETTLPYWGPASDLWERMHN